MRVCECVLFHHTQHQVLHTQTFAEREKKDSNSGVVLKYTMSVCVFELLSLATDRKCSCVCDHKWAQQVSYFSMYVCFFLLSRIDSV